MNKKEILNLIQSNNKPFYVYALLRNKTPFYIGKGKIRNHTYMNYTERIFDHYFDAINTNINSHKLNIIRKLIKENKDLDYKIYDFFNTDIEACNLEIELIRKYGRLVDKSGILTNLTLGGDTMIGFVRSEELREKDSIISKKYNKNHPEKASNHSIFMKNYFKNEENIKKKSETTKQSFINDPNLKERQSNKLKENYKKDPHFKKIWRDCSLKTYNEHPEVKDKIRKSVLKLWKDSEYRNKQIQKRKEVCNRLDIRRKNSEAQIKAHKRRKEIKDRCINLITIHKLNIQLPNGRSSIQTFLDFEKHLLNIIPI